MPNTTGDVGDCESELKKYSLRSRVGGFTSMYRAGGIRARRAKSPERVSYTVYQRAEIPTTRDGEIERRTDSHFHIALQTQYRENYITSVQRLSPEIKSAIEAV